MDIVVDEGLSRPNRDFNLKTNRMVFPEPELYDDDDQSKWDEMIGQVHCFDICALQVGDIVAHYESDGCFRE